MKSFFKVLFFGFVVLSSAVLVEAQMKRRTGAEVTVNPSAEPLPSKTPVKKNDRPSEPNKPQTSAPAAAKNAPAFYKYEFSQPNFLVKHIIIEHDENGKGKITFEKKEADEPITDPVQISNVSLEKINNLLQTLNFVESGENYQSPTRDYGHLGNYTITVKMNDKERTAKYNWTENLEARALAEEYQKISEQYVWLFDMSVARANQPLEAPGLMDRLDSLIKRSQISDPAQLIPILKQLSVDEKLPLMARNRATKIIGDIEKKK